MLAYPVGATLERQRPHMYDRLLILVLAITVTHVVIRVLGPLPMLALHCKRPTFRHA